MCRVWNDTDPGAGVEADVDGASEEDKVALGELEGAESGRQRVAVHRVEVLEQVRVHRTTALHQSMVAEAKTKQETETELSIDQSTNQ